MKVYNSFTDRIVDNNAFQAASKLIELKKNKNKWFVIEEIVRIWKKTKPNKWISQLLYIKDLKETRKDQKYGSTKSKNSGLRITLDIPQDVIRMIRVIYPVEELPMDRKFFREFARRFNSFQIPEKI